MEFDLLDRQTNDHGSQKNKYRFELVSEKHANQRFPWLSRSASSARQELGHLGPLADQPARALDQDPYARRCLALGMLDLVPL